MKIKFVNHSSFIVETDKTSLICDPWLEGSVFNNGWKLLSDTQFSYDDFSRINYIWFSHEHPDHFYPPNIQKIPPEFRENITVLFQHTIDKRVIDFCKKQNFKQIIELYPDKWHELDEDLKILCEHYAEGDSWICFKGNGLTYLNTNDCGIRNKSDALQIKEKVGAVDVLFTQFSYAYWAGNPEDRNYRQRLADEKLMWLKFQCDIFQPTVTIPIASYIYFSHEENFYLNDSINTARKTYDFIKNKTASRPVILYSGETYDFPAPHDSEASIARYEKDYESIMAAPVCAKTGHVSEESLLSSAGGFIDELNEHNVFYLKLILRPANVFVKDLGKAYRLSLHGFDPVDLAEENCDVSMTSENLQFCFRFPYGLDTTQINGRLRKPKNGHYLNFYSFFRINQHKSRGVDPNSPAFLSLAIWRKILYKLGVRRV